MNRPSPTSVSLSVRGLTVQFADQVVLHNLNLPDLGAGQLVALLGPNGSGKSSLLKGIAGLAVSSARVLSVGDVDLKKLDAAARSKHVRYLPQELSRDVHITVAEAILVALNARGSQDRNQAFAAVESTLQRLDIGTLISRYVDELSGGQKQMVALAQALVHWPQVLLLDEPLASLDLNHQHQVMSLLRHLASERQLLIVIVMHDLNGALRYADQAILMRESQVVISGPPKQVITPASIAQTFSVNARVEECSLGLPFVVVDGISPQ